MRIRDRYKKLGLWTRIGVWGSIASLIGIPLAIYLSTASGEKGTTIVNQQTRRTSVTASGNHSPAVSTSGDRAAATVAADHSSVANVTIGPQTFPGGANVVAPGGTVTVNAPSAPEPLTDEALATVLSMMTASDTNGNPLVRIEMAFRNEGNRSITIRQVLLCLSETPSFDLPIYRHWDHDGPVLVEAKNSLLTSMVFGRGTPNCPMILSRGFDEPLIYARLAVEVIDTHGRLHSIGQDACTLQFTPLLHIEWRKMPPWDITLLPSDAPPPYLSLAPDPKAVELELKVVNGRAHQVTNDGPLNWRLQGIYTNDPKGNWPARPWTNSEVYRRIEPYQALRTNMTLTPGKYDVHVPPGGMVMISYPTGPATGDVKQSKTFDQVVQELIEANQVPQGTARILAAPEH